MTKKTKKIKIIALSVTAVLTASGAAFWFLRHR